MYHLAPWDLAGGAHELTFGELREFLEQASDIELRQSYVVPAHPKGT